MESIKLFKEGMELFRNYISGQFHRVQVLIGIEVFLGLFFVWLHGQVGKDLGYERYMYSSIIFGVLLFWLFYKYSWPYPKNKNKTGIIISLYAEDYECTKMKGKFLKEFQKNINDSGLYKYFNIISIPNHYAEKIKTKKDIEALHKKINGRIYFYGEVQKEVDGKNKKYFINVDGYVRHLPIPIPVSQELGFDFRTVLPKEFIFEEFFGFRGCRATAKIIYITTRYVVGVASFLSGNPFLAIDMHKNLAKEIEGEYKKINNDGRIRQLTKFDFKQLKKIKNKLPLIIANEAQVIARIYYLNSDEKNAQKMLAKSLENNPNSYSVLLLKAIFKFEYDNDPEGAFKIIQRAKKLAKNRYEWKYSWAFLKFWKGKYREAYKMCKKIGKQHYPLEDIIVLEIEEFNLNILKKVGNYEKPQLLFWIAFLNYKKKYNLTQALKFFEEFLEFANKDREEFLIQRANSFLSEIKKEMKIN